MPVSLDHESALWRAGYSVVVGIDEVGRGALAGPVMVGAVALARCDAWPDGLADSKQLTRAARERLADAVAAFGVGRAVGEASAAEVDVHGIVGALRLAGLRAIASLHADAIAIDAVLLDGRHDWLTAPAASLFEAATASSAREGPPVPPVTTVVKGDDACASIAAASIIAKVARDAVMRRAHARHPEYGWEHNVGYGAEDHMDALRRLGPTALHRTSWKLPARVDAPAGG